MFRPRSLPELRTDRLCIKLLEPQRADIMVRFRLANREYLKPWEPRRSPEFFTDAFWQLQLRYSINEFREGHSVCFVLLDPDEEEVLGVCNYTNIVRGTFQACHLGYALGEVHQGKGIMYEALVATNSYLFQDFGLNRIMANYLPHNERSGRLLARLGFAVEGRADKFLKIDGKWEDHILTSKLNPAARYD